ncbi:MAG: FtsX-like permease family protein, partial [Longimicrobiales bacterium]
FDALRVPVLRGRAFTPADRADAPPVVLVNRTLARRLWGDGDPIGARVSVGGGETWATVVGVVGDTRQDGLATPPNDELYAPLNIDPPLGASLVVRTAGDPRSLAGRIADEVHAVDPRQPVAFVQTLAEVRHAATASPRLTATLLLLFAGLALGIAAAGIAGVAANAVNRRTREIGIRMALGSARRSVVVLLMRQTLAPVAIGMIAGTVAAIAGTRLVAGLLFETPPTDVVTFAGVAVVLGLAAMLATLAPALRAARIDPRVAFQADG